ncbi:uncharacterized protein LOC114533757 [Dendronephthya gigantea]|uniref:uncharacterized protein LOC114533757 n=1 Tax=Dendronephthya gigantea TaxID=151771 RepID=UPI00106D96B7|nr:uncharacterized protein LOC114533757 [Dendronephthya gigantea]
MQEISVDKQVDSGKTDNEGTENRALIKVKDALYSVKVSRHDATEVQREIEGELFDKWHEGCEVMEAKGIKFSDVPKFLDHMREAYQGIDADARKKMDGIRWTDEWAYKIIELKYNNSSSDSSARYGMIAFSKSNDGGIVRVDCMYCLYKLDFDVAPQRIVTTAEETLQESVPGIKSPWRIKNFFRYKALEGFYKEGLIDRINIVPSIEDVHKEENKW